MRRRRKRRSQSEVELNLAAMLDMAFQLLAFFVLTFRPPPLEGQISLRLPPPLPVTGAKTGENPGEDLKNNNPLQGTQHPDDQRLRRSQQRRDRQPARRRSAGLRTRRAGGQAEGSLRRSRQSVRPGDYPGQRFLPLRRVDESHRHLHPPETPRRQEALETEFRGVAQRITVQQRPRCGWRRNATDNVCLSGGSVALSTHPYERKPAPCAAIDHYAADIDLPRRRSAAGRAAS